MDVSLQPHYPIMGGGGYPQYPLRELYENSDRVVVATVGETVKLKDLQYGSELKKTLNVSSTLKGDGHKSTIAIHESVSGIDGGRLRTGDQVLVFLNRRETGKGEKESYEIKGYDSGVKKLSAADLQSYLQHIDDLKTILDAEKPDRDAIIEWLVRCVEDPATRYEGALELSAHANEYRYRQEREKAKQEQADEQNAKSEEMIEENVEIIRFLPTGVTNQIRQEDNLITLLTDQQKERLMAVLLRAEEIKDAEFALIDIVKDWHDKRLLPFLIARLRNDELIPSLGAIGIMQDIAEILPDNDDLYKALENYAEHTTYEDLETAVKQEAEDQESPETDDEDNSRRQKKTPLEAIQERSAMVKEFLKLVEKKLAKEAQ